MPGYVHICTLPSVVSLLTPIMRRGYRDLQPTRWLGTIKHRKGAEKDQYRQGTWFAAGMVGNESCHIKYHALDDNIAALFRPAPGRQVVIFGIHIQMIHTMTTRREYTFGVYRMTRQGLVFCIHIMTSIHIMTMVRHDFTIVDTISGAHPLPVPATSR